MLPGSLLAFSTASILCQLSFCTDRKLFHFFYLVFLYAAHFSCGMDMFSGG
jgi:hypothetical protein